MSGAGATTAAAREESVAGRAAAPGPAAAPGFLARLRARRPASGLGRILLYEVLRYVVLLVFVLGFRGRVYGARRVPAHGPVLLIANHQSYLDPPLIGVGITQRQLDYVARVGLFANPALSWLIVALNALPIKEDRGDAGAMKEILRLLGEGHAVVIFPEGSRTEDGGVTAFKRGIALLIKRAACPVVPVAIEGAFDAWPRHRPIPSLVGKRISVMFGEAIPHADVMRRGPDAALETLRAEVDRMRLELRRRLRRASGGTYPARGPGDAASPGARAPGGPPTAAHP